LNWRHWDPKSGAIDDPLSSLSTGLQGFGEIVSDPVEGVWICGSNQLVHLYGGKISRYAIPLELTGGPLTHMTRDNKGTLWFLCQTSRKIFRFREGVCSVLDCPELPSKDLRCLLVDREGLIWVGTGESGLLQIRPRQFISLLTTNASGERVEVYSVT